MAISHRQILGSTIRKLRKEAGLSQEKLAEKADLSSKYVSEVERGRVNISLDTLIRISKVLKVPLPEVIRGI